MKVIDITGQRFGRLVVMGQAESRRNSKNHIETRWKCKCDCGNEKILSKGTLRNGNAISCGCYKREYVTAKNTKHNGTRTRLYRIWNGMRRRCECPTEKAYANYGKRGIKVCEEWKDFGKFRDWAYQNGYKEPLTIKRIDVNGNYEPSNCKWIPKSEQSKNRRNLHYITVDGVTKNLSEWCSLFHIDRETVRKYEKKFGDGEQAIKYLVNRK